MLGVAENRNDFSHKRVVIVHTLGTHWDTEMLPGTLETRTKKFTGNYVSIGKG